jgi:hypothetical protein
VQFLNGFDPVEQVSIRCSGKALPNFVNVTGRSQSGFAHPHRIADAEDVGSHRLAPSGRPKELAGAAAVLRAHGQGGYFDECINM